MATPKKRTDCEYRAGKYHHWVYFASILFPLLVFLCASSAIGQESQQEAHRQARAWLEFNHHVGGMVVLVLAGLTWLEVLGIGPTMTVRLAWPSCLILIGLYNVMFSDWFAWPIRPSGLIESLSNPEVLQHKVLAVMVLTLGLIELLRRLERMTHTAWLYLFYGIAVLTASILVVHDVGVGPHAHSDGLTAIHIQMGLLALLALVLKVLVDRGILIGRSTYLYPLSLVGLALQLLLFTDSSGMVR